MDNAETGSVSPAAPNAVDMDSVGRDVLEARCNLLEQSVRASAVVAAEEIDAMRPGGAQNRDPSAQGWLAFFAALHRWHAVGALQTLSASRVGRWDAQQMADAQAALSASPLPVSLESVTGKSVYPKSEYACNRIVYLDLAIKFVVEQRLKMIEVPDQTPDVLAALEDATELESRLVREVAWILTHPGPDVPWPDDGAWEHTPPEWTRALTPFDIIAIQKAHIEVNLRRINAIAERTRQLAEATEDQMPMAAFLGVMAGELHVQPRELLRRWSLGEVFVQSLVRWESHRRAEDKAERERAADQLAAR